MSAAKEIKFKSEVSDDSNNFYGVIVVSDICYEDDSPVKISNFLGLTFVAPTSEQPGVDQEPWSPAEVDISTETMDDSTMKVTAKISWEGGSHEIREGDKLCLKVNGDLKDNPVLYSDSVRLCADGVPSEST